MGFSIRKMNKLLKADDSANPTPLTMRLQIGKDPGGKFIEADFLIDTGFLAAAVAIPNEMATELGIEASNSVQTMMANGSTQDMKIGQCAIIFDDQGLSGGSCVLDAKVPTVGMQLLSMFDIFIQSGQIKHLKLSDEAVKRLEPYNQNESSDQTAVSLEPRIPTSKPR